MSGSDYTKTPNYDLYLPVPGEDDDVWGDHINFDISTIDTLIKSVSDKADSATVGTVTKIDTSGSGISGGPITTTGMLTVAWNAGAVSSLSGLNLAGGVLSVPAQAFSTLTGAATFAQLPVSVQSVPISFPFASKPATGAIVNVPMAMALTVPASLAGTTVYDTTKTTGNAVFTVNKISGGSTTALGTITVTSTSNTSATLAGAGGAARGSAHPRGYRHIAMPTLTMPHELPMQPLRSGLPCDYSFTESGITADPIAFAIRHDVHTEPRAVTTSPIVNAFDPRGGVAHCASTVLRALVDVDRPQISDPVVLCFSIDMVDPLGNWLSIDHRPSDAMCLIKNPREAKLPVVAAISGGASCDLPGPNVVPSCMGPLVRKVMARPCAPSENTGVRVVIHALANERDFGQFLGSHDDPPVGRVVRGDAGASNTASLRL
jgi:hypothetical protein